MHQLFSIGYSLMSIAALLWMVCGVPDHLESLYNVSLNFDGAKEKQEMFPQAQNVSKGIWFLDFPELREKLPDLRQELVFLGSNNRPDACGGKFFLELATSKDTYVASANEKVYLQVVPSPEGGIFTFSPEGKPTDLWLECRPLSMDNRIEVKVRLLGVNREVITSPKERETLLLNAPVRGMESWEIGGVRVDASFPMKQKIRRIGSDKFLLMHGGSDYADKAVKERVDFVSLADENYSRYLAVGDILLWDGNCWQTCGEFRGKSSEVPLLEVKKIDEKVMVIEVWNVGGTSRQSMSLVKTMSSPIEVAEIIKEFEFVGMRSWSRPIIQAGGQRMILSPDDWVVYTGKSWEKITRKEQLEDYLSGKTQGPLLVFDKLEKDSREFVLRAHVFNAQRTLVEAVTLPLKPGFDVGYAASKEEAIPGRQALVGSEGTNRGGS
ncbi:hypothetical protein [Chlamydia abortus]|uniref:Uncharacterized protein n=1 Tax=Chlamydia abortus (strain DSM 27085 / S26/3) TaxID=218497 RepID=Q5L4T9_CHLAB|nr:hypothetical protein [Chlamydia abortus]ASD31018.1 hypothetical protein CEF07_04825 [Chlamydia abortus]EGK69648.1 hypothetical protein CAB1_0941 [Chlamydia abortus LLG]QEM74243.1 hypothetical protein DZK34_04855 [Chlamydia abortus]QRR31661.1 hypothetical protein JS522_04765 [Chlamydia abortus]CAH64357.1 conserved hypothetical protein [Chlamydia abortus S26/3]